MEVIRLSLPFKLVCTKPAATMMEFCSISLVLSTEWFVSIYVAQSTPFQVQVGAVATACAWLRASEAGFGLLVYKLCYVVFSLGKYFKLDR